MADFFVVLKQTSVVRVGSVHGLHVVHFTLFFHWFTKLNSRQNNVVMTTKSNKRTNKCKQLSYLGIGEKMLRPARNFFIVPPALNQLCLFSCWTFRNSLLRCFHCWEMKVLRILKYKTHFICVLFLFFFLIFEPCNITPLFCFFGCFYFQLIKPEFLQCWCP